MRQIPQKEFFRMLIDGMSVKLGAPVYPGYKEISDGLMRELMANVPDSITPRKVIHSQSNAIMFENKSWLHFTKPKKCDSRKAYLHEIDEKVLISLVDHRPSYKNMFGTPIDEQTTVLAYLMCV